jgi:hypothetical protein
VPPDYAILSRTETIDNYDIINSTLIQFPDKRAPDKACPTSNYDHFQALPG